MKNFISRAIISISSICFVCFIIIFSNNWLVQHIAFLLIMLIIITSLIELYKLSRLKKNNLFLTVMILGALIQLFIFYIYNNSDDCFFYSSSNLMLYLLACFLINFNKIKESLHKISFLIFSMIYISLPLSMLILILFNNSEDGRFWLIYLILTTKATDIFAYIGGKLIGKYKLAKELSPKKTIEGAIIGLISAVAVSYCFHLIMDTTSINFYLTSTQSLILGLIIGIVAQIGDLSASILKRNAKIKDSNKIPGVGGFIDMIDSLIFIIPILLLFLKLKG